MTVLWRDLTFNEKSESIRMGFLLFLVLALLNVVSGELVLGDAGQDCWQVCHARGENCLEASPDTRNGTTLFAQLGIHCGPNTTLAAFNQEWHPALLSNATCVGYVGVPAGSFCGGRSANARRLCRWYDLYFHSCKYGC